MPHAAYKLLISASATHTHKFCAVADVVPQVAPSCSIESDSAKVVEAALSSAFVSRVYHPDVEQGLGGKAPHLALWHEEGEEVDAKRFEVVEPMVAVTPSGVVMLVVGSARKVRCSEIYHDPPGVLGQFDLNSDDI